MSLFKFGDFETEVDFTDADFLTDLEYAQEKLSEDAAKVPKTGKTAELFRAQCQCYFNFFDYLFGEGTHEAMFQGRTSYKLCIEAGEKLSECENTQTEEFFEKYDRYNVQEHGNRQQRRYYNKQHGKKKKQHYKGENVMNILFEEFPKTVRVNGERFLVETDFREWIRFIQLIDDAKVPWQIKCRLLLQWYIDGIPDDLETAVYALGDFLAMKTENAEEDESITGSAPKQLYSFEQDAECIYSAFREVYGINLQTIPYMHWWEFQTLFAGLPEKTEIKQRIMYRSIDLRTIKDKDERKRIKKIQEIVALKKKNQRKMTDYEIGDMFA